MTDVITKWRYFIDAFIKAFDIHERLIESMEDTCQGSATETGLWVEPWEDW